MVEAFDRLRAALESRYQIEHELGAGGMATVYLARDLKHERHVAVKVLRPELAAVLGGERFLREIRVTANLQHPHILPLYDSGEADTFLYYVMPYVEGESLRDKLTREKQLAIDEALEITKQVASALDFAHRHDVLHRDIKPENILVHEGQALVADFGIALAVRAAGGTRLTETGLSLGTPHYMSPEQAMGDRQLDARSDIYSLGCVVYEMLVGDPPHTGSTAQAILAKVVTDTPRPMTTLRDTVPVHVEAAVHKALAKLPADRFPAASVFSEALTHAVEHPVPLPASAVEAPTTPIRRHKTLATRLAWPVVGMLAIAVAALSLTRWPTASENAVMRFAITLPAEQQLVIGPVSNSLAISPDGTQVVYQAESGGVTRLYLRRVDQFEAEPLPGTEGGDTPFFSPDGGWVGFFSGGTLRKVLVEGSVPQVICDVPTPSLSASWGPDGTILFDDNGLQLWRVPATGGSPERLTTPDTEAGEIGHQGPSFLPDGEGVLFTIWTSRGSRVAVLSLKTREWRSVELSDRPNILARYLPTGYLLYPESDRIVMAPFDPRRVLLNESRVSVLEGVYSHSFAILVPPGTSWCWWTGRDGLRPSPKCEVHFLAFRPTGKRSRCWTASPCGSMTSSGAVAAVSPRAPRIRCGRRMGRALPLAGNPIWCGRRRTEPARSNRF
jgi:serine/threonine-protein kinase